MKYLILSALLPAFCVSPAFSDDEVPGAAAAAPDKSAPSVAIPSAAATASQPAGAVKKTAPNKTTVKKTASKKPPPAPKLIAAAPPPKKSATAKPKDKDQPPAASSAGTTKPLSAYELGRYQYCGDDRDCMPAVNGCCDCANGGEDVAVNKERYEAFRGRFDCLYVSCGEKTGRPPCGSGLVSCLNHKCKYYTDLELEQKF